MNDTEFLQYMETHVDNDSPLFSSDQIRRLLNLTNSDSDFFIPNWGMYETADIKELCTKARSLLKANNE